MAEKIIPLKKTARVAGLLYFSIALAAPFSLLYVPSKTFVNGDARATAEKILTHEFLFRSGIVIGMVSTVLFLFVVLLLYKLFKNVNEYQAKLMIALVLVQIPIDFLLDTFSITSLMILKGDILKTLDIQQKQDMAMLFLKIGHYGTLILEIFWGLWLIPFGQLVYKSGFIPRIFGVFLILNGIAYMLTSITFILQPNHQALIERYTLPFLFGELAIMLWLLIKGVKDNTHVPTPI